MKIRKNIYLGEPLTPEEEKIMDLLSVEGKRTSEIALQLKTTREGVLYSLIVIKIKLGAKTLYQAVNRHTLLTRKEV